MKCLENPHQNPIQFRKEIVMNKPPRSEPANAGTEKEGASTPPAGYSPAQLSWAAGRQRLADLLGELLARHWLRKKQEKGLEPSE
jgi:hypothetical protein